MSQKLYVRRGGGASVDTEVTAFTGRKGVPFFDGNQPLIQMGHRFEEGEASQGYFKLIDPVAELPTSTFRLPPHALVTWTEDASGNELWLSRGRVHPLESGIEVTRGGQGAKEIVWDVTVNDCNMDLGLLPFSEPWERPRESGRARLVALQAYILNGASSTSPNVRVTTEITVAGGDHLCPNTELTDMPAKTYPPGTHPGEVLSECRDTEGKVGGVVIHHLDGESHLCLLYIKEDNHSLFTSPIKISDEIADWDPTDPSAPVFEPIYDMGKASVWDHDGVITALVSRWGGTNDEPRFVYVDRPALIDDYEYAGDTFEDSESTDEDQAEAVANRELDYRHVSVVTHRVSIKVPAAVHPLLCTGMSLQIKAAAVAGGPDLGDYVTRRIAELKWEPAPDGDLYAHMQLGRGLRRKAPRRGPGRNNGFQPGSTSPKPPPVCDPVPAGAVETVLASTDGGEFGGTTTAGACWGGVAHHAIGGSGHTVPGGGVAVTPGDTVYARLNFREETGNDPWENNTNYDYDFDFKFSHTVSLAVTFVPIVNQLYHNTGCINVIHEATTVVPPGYNRMQLVCRSKLGGTRYRGEIGTLDLTDAVDCPPGSVTSDVPLDEPGTYLPPSAVQYLIDQAIANQNVGSVKRVMRNNSGDNLDAGMLVVPDTATLDAVTTTTTAAQTALPGGLVLTGGADQADVTVLWFGRATDLVVNGGGTPAADDYIFSSTVAGEVDLDATRDTGAMGVVAYDGSDLVVYWWGTPDSGSGGGGGGSLTVQEADATVDAAATTIDFGHGLDVTSSPAGEANVAVNEAELDHALIGGTSPDIAKSIFSVKGELLGASANDTPALVSAGTEGQMPVARAAATAGVAMETIYGAIEVIIDGSGAVIATGVKCDIRIPFPLEIVRASLFGDASGSIVIDLWRDIYANFPPTVADTITASAKPTLSSAAKSEDATLTGWSKTCAEGSIIRVNVDSVTTLQRVTLELRYKRT